MSNSISPFPNANIPSISQIPHFSGASGAAAIGAAGLTPEGMMLYCQSQLGFIDDGIQQQMAQQQAMHTTVGHLTDLKVALGKSLMDNNDGAAKAAAVGAFKTAYDALAPDDTAGREKLNATFQDFVTDAYCIDDHAAGGHYNLANLSAADVHNLDAAAAASADKNKVSGDDLKRYSTAVDGVSTELTNGAELQMIKLQGAVSQRQMVIQLTTQIISKMNDSFMAIASQIGK